MAFQFTNYAGIQPQGNPGMRNLLNSLMQGYKLGGVPRQMRQESEGRELDNQGKELTNRTSQMNLENAPEEFKLAQLLKNAQIQNMNMRNQQAPEEFKLAQALKNAQIQRALRPDQPKLSNIENTISGLKRIRDQYGEDSNEFKMANQMAMKDIIGKSGMQGLESPTKAFVTKNQNVIQSIDNALPMIKELKAFHSPGQLFGKHFHPDMQAKYESLTSTITDSLVNSLGLPKTNESIALIGKIVGKRALESDKAYDKRLEGLAKELQERRNKSLKVLRSGNVSLNESEAGLGDFSNVSDDELRRIAGGG